MPELREYTDAELMALPPVIIATGETDARGVARGGHLRNPFADQIGDSQGMALAARWSAIHWGEDGNGVAAASDPFDLLREALSPQRLFHEGRGEAGNLVAVHPLEAGGAETWEAASMWMHESQEPVFPIEEKPAEPMAPVLRPLYHGTPAAPAEPMRFEDTEESKQLRGIHRGD